MYPDDPESADYRVLFVIQTHWSGFILIIIGLGGVVSGAFGDWAAGLGGVGSVQWLLDWTRDKCRIVASIEAWTGVLFALFFVGAKFHYHRSRKTWVESRGALREKEVGA